METLELNAQKARELLRRAVDERGASYCYSNGETDCQYFDRNPTSGEWEPGCIVGHVLAYAGFTYEDLAERVANSDTVSELVNAGYLIAPERVVRALRAAQTAQDNGLDWGESLNEFDIALAGPIPCHGVRR